MRRRYMAWPLRLRSAAPAAAVAVVAALLVAGAGAPPPDAPPQAFGALATPAPIGSRLPDEGNLHVPDGQRVTYGTTPPTSGSHWASATAWGIKAAQEVNERTVHNLEHGGIVIAYDPTLAPADVTRLRAYVGGTSAVYRKIVLEPYAGLGDGVIAVTAWRWLLKLPSYDEGQIAAFIAAHYQGPDAPEAMQQ